MTAKSGWRCSAPTAAPWPRPVPLTCAALGRRHRTASWKCAPHDDRIDYAVFSPDGKTLLTASWDHTARLWDAATGSPLSQPFRHEAQVNSVAFSPDGKIVLTASADRSARAWDAGLERSLVRTLPHPGSVRRRCSTPTASRFWWALTRATSCSATRQLFNPCSLPTGMVNPSVRWHGLSTADSLLWEEKKAKHRSWRSADVGRSVLR